MSNVLVARREARRRRKIRVRKVWIGLALILILGVVLYLKYYAFPEETPFLPREENTVEALSDEIVPGKMPMFFQYDRRWKNEMYGDGTMEFNGCGPTCLSMVLCGLNGTAEYNPLTVARLADKWGYYAEGSGSLWSLMTEGAENLGLTAREVVFDESHIRQELLEGRPIICTVGPGDFTTTGHFILLCQIDENDMVTVHDPNSEERSKRLWNLEKLMPQIKNLWSYQ